MKKWEISRVREEHDEEISQLAEELNVGFLTGVLLYNRGFTSAKDARAFIAKQTDSFYDPFLLKDMDRAVEGVERALEKRRKIVIYGDYDVDGVTSVSALYLYLLSRGADIGYYIPSRCPEGYGVNIQAVDQLYRDGAGLIITVDTGITASEEIAYARSIGLDFIVTDHHACHKDLPCALAVVNPHRSDCPYPFKELAGVGVVFKLICALEKRRRQALGQNGAEYLRFVCEQYADLVAIGTVADVMPLTDENRLIVSLGLSMIEHTGRKGLAALIEQAGSANKKKKINASFIGFVIAPRINAAGRIGHAGRAVELFLCEREEDAVQIAQELCATNKKRQQEENAIVEEATQKIEKEFDLTEDEVIVLAENEWHQGVIGIVASRLTEKYGVPSILISFEGDIGKGSGRSVKGINLVDALSACSDLLLKFGGHELAAGLSISRENLPEFRKRLNEYVREHKDRDYVDLLPIDCVVNPEEITVKNAEQIALLEPYGTENPEPVFALMGAAISEAKLIGGGKHTKFVFEKDGIRCDAVYFGCNLLQTNLYAGDLVDVAFRLSVNDFMNMQTAQMLVSDICLSGESARYMEQERSLYENSKSGRKIAAEENIIPAREDFAAVYRYIKSEVRRENDIIGIKGISRRIPSVNYVKARYIIEIFREVNIVGIENYGPEPDIYRFRLKPATGKVNLDKSSIYKRLKSRKEYK